MSDTISIPNFFSAPITVAIEITGKCNLRCKYCCVGNAERKNDLRTSELKRIVRECIDNKVMLLDITGGEPFLREDLFEILDAIKGACQFSIKTNATLITEDIAKRLKKHPNLRGIGVSLDGPDCTIHDLSRGQSSFNQVIRGIEALKSNNIMFGLMVTVNKYNSGCLENIVTKAKELGANNVTFNRPMYIGNGVVADCFDLSARQFKEIAYYIRKLKNQYPNYVITGEWDMLATLNDLKDAMDGGKLDGDICQVRGCTLGVGSLFIRSDG